MTVRVPRAADHGKRKNRTAAREPRRGKSSGDTNTPATADSLLPAAALLLITFVAYLPALRIGFIWDDDTHLTANIVTEPGGLWRSWFTTEQPNYWPVTWSAFWLQWKLFGLNPLGYHVVNVALHGVNAVLAWRVLRRLAVPGAWLAALLFAVHPVNVETAAWVTQLKSLLAMGLYLASLLCFLRFEDEGGRRWYGAAVPLFLVAMLSKPSVVMMPVVLLLVAWWRRGRIGRADLLRSLPFFAISGLLSLTEIWFQYNRSIQEVVVRDDGFLARLAGSGWVLWFYLSKVLVPWNLMFVYPRWEIRPEAPLHWLPLAALAGVATFVWTKRHGWGRPFLFALGYFAVTLAPVLGFLNIFYMRYSFVADHWQYQSMIGIVALAAGGATHLARTRLPSRPALLNGGAAAVALLLTALSWSHQRTYWSMEGLWEDTLRRNPKAWIAHQCLGELLSRQGRLDEAIAHFREELKIAPGFAEPYYNLGITLAAKGQLDEALSHYDRAVELDPRCAEAHNNAGVLLASQGRYDEAVARYRAALDIRPAYADAHVNWGLALAARQELDEAAKHYAEALRLNPRHAGARTNWGAALMAQGRVTEAVEHLARAAELEPDSPDAHLNLARALAAAGRLSDAIRSCETALRIAPGYPKAQSALSAFRARLGQ